MALGHRCKISGPLTLTDSFPEFQGQNSGSRTSRRRK